MDDCYGRLWIDDDDTECPYIHCVVRERCKVLFESARAIQIGKAVDKDQRLLRHNLKPLPPADPEVEARYRAWLRAESLKFSYRLLQAKYTHKTGDQKPFRLPYTDNGSKSHQWTRELMAIAADRSLPVTLGKYVMSVLINTNTYLFKVDLRRQKSIQVYCRNELSDYLHEHKVFQRGLHDTERHCFPVYFGWVAIIREPWQFRHLKTWFQTTKIAC